MGEGYELRQVGKYRVEARLGAGGMGIVYAAYDHDLQRKVAIKFLLAPEQVGGAWLESARRLRDEANATARVRHPGLITILDAGEDERFGPYIVYEFLDGGTLREALRRRGPLPFAEALDCVGVPVLEALAALHEAGVVHRDIKPENLFQGEDGTFKVGDLGLAVFEGREAQTRTGISVGTPGYLSPGRIVHPDRPASAAADCYAAAVVLVETVTGRIPFHGDHAAALLHDQIKRVVTADDLVLEGVPRAVAHVFAEALHPEAVDRRSDATAFLADLLAAWAQVADSSDAMRTQQQSSPSVSNRDLLAESMSTRQHTLPPTPQDLRGTLRQVPPPEALPSEPGRARVTWIVFGIACLLGVVALQYVFVTRPVVSPPKTTTAPILASARRVAGGRGVDRVFCNARRLREFLADVEAHSRQEQADGVVSKAEKERWNEALRILTKNAPAASAARAIRSLHRKRDREALERLSAAVKGLRAVFDGSTKPLAAAKLELYLEYMSLFRRLPRRVVAAFGGDIFEEDLRFLLQRRGALSTSSWTVACSTHAMAFAALTLASTRDRGRWHAVMDVLSALTLITANKRLTLGRERILATTEVIARLAREEGGPAVEEPLAALAEIARHLRDGGRASSSSVSNELNESSRKDLKIALEGRAIIRNHLIRFTQGGAQRARALGPPMLRAYRRSFWFALGGMLLRHYLMYADVIHSSAEIARLRSTASADFLPFHKLKWGLPFERPRIGRLTRILLAEIVRRYRGIRVARPHAALTAEAQLMTAFIHYREAMAKKEPEELANLQALAKALPRGTVVRSLTLSLVREKTEVAQKLADTDRAMQIAQANVESDGPKTSEFHTGAVISLLAQVCHFRWRLLEKTGQSSLRAGEQTAVVGILLIRPWISDKVPYQTQSLVQLTTKRRFK